MFRLRFVIVFFVFMIGCFEAKSDFTQSMNSSVPTASEAVLMNDAMSDERDDPFEGMNRMFFGLNEYLDGLFFEPMAKIYRGVFPEFVRIGVHNVLGNLQAPFNFLNYLLQFDGERAVITVARFFVNTIFGFAGIFDVASEMGLERADTSFGETLKVWKFETGPYIVLPVLGSSSPRGILGIVVDFFFDPFNVVMRQQHQKRYIAVRTGLSILDLRSSTIESLEGLKKSSLDYYVARRSIYFQRNPNI